MIVLIGFYAMILILLAWLDSNGDPEGLKRFYTLEYRYPLKTMDNRYSAHESEYNYLMQDVASSDFNLTEKGFGKMVHIQSLTPSDGEALAKLYLELSGNLTDLRKMQANLFWLNANSDYYLFGAKNESGELLGSLMAIVCRDIIGSCRPFMVLKNVIVAEKYRGHGIGGQLIRAIEKVALDKDCYYIEFVSSIDRKAAHRFYETMGYKPNVVQGYKKYLSETSTTTG